MKAMWMAAGLALISSAGASAGDTPHAQHAASPAPQQANAEAKPEQVMLKCIDQRITGSRTRAKRICLTDAQWAQRSVNETEELERLREKTAMGPGGAF